MKKISFALVSLLFLLISCNPDEPENDPNVSLRTKLVDYWKVNEQSQNFKGTKSYYTVEILKHQTDSSKMLIDNFTISVMGNKLMP